MKKIFIAGVLFVLIGWAFKEIFIPNWIAAGMVANEYKAYLSCRTIHEAFDTYKNAHGTYPEGLAALGSGAPAYLSKGLARGKTRGYRYYHEVTPSGYVVRAVPAKWNYTGRYIFHVDGRGTITVCDKNAECVPLGDNWQPHRPSMPYPYKLGAGCIE